LRSPFIIGRAVETERLSSSLPELRDIAGKEDAVGWIRQALKVERISDSDLYEVSFTTRFPESAKAVVAAIVKTYMEYQATQSDDQRHRMLDQLAAEQVVRDADIDLKREKLRMLVKHVGGEDLVMERGEPGDKSLELEFARDELDNAIDVRRRIAERATRLTIESRAPSQVIPVQLAQLPEFPEGPTLAKPYLMIAGGALLGPLILLLIWDVLHLRSRARAAAITLDD
jgi:uncharacterized protein involved in exopolysaccharide biosynthesis